MRRLQWDMCSFSMTIRSAVRMQSRNFQESAPRAPSIEDSKDSKICSGKPRRGTRRSSSAFGAELYRTIHKSATLQRQCVVPNQECRVCQIFALPPRPSLEKHPVASNSDDVRMIQWSNLRINRTSSFASLPSFQAFFERNGTKNPVLDPVMILAADAESF